MSAADHHRSIARLAQRGAHLRVDTAELCCLAAMHLQAEAGGSMLFEEDALAALFEATIAAVERPESPRTRATYAIERLRAQGLVVRLDGAGIVRAGEYALSPLALAIVKRHLADERLTRESLDGLMHSIVAGLEGVRAAAEVATETTLWSEKVRLPLELVVAELLNGVERRQLGLDEAQRTIRAEITRLLEADWLDALGGIEAMLERTGDTLTELKSLLLQHANTAHAVLDDIQALAQEAGRIEVLIAVRRTGDQIDRLLAWGRSRHEAWSEYHRSVHRFLRDVVRLDPDRQLSTRLRAFISDWPQRPFALRVAAPPRLVSLPLPTRSVLRPPVRRVQQDWSPGLVAPVEAPPVDIAARVTLALASGALSLADVVAQVLEGVPDDERYGLVGQVAAQVAARAQRRHGLGPWVEVGDTDIEVTDWTLAAEADDA